MAAADTAKKAASGAVNTAWSATKWTLMRPFRKSTYVFAAGVVGIGLAATTLAPPAAFAAAVNGLPPIPGVFDYIGAGSEIAWAGCDVAWNIASAVGATLPETTVAAVEAAQMAALEAS